MTAPGPYYGPCGCWRRDAPRRSSSSATTACSGASRRAAGPPGRPRSWSTPARTAIPVPRVLEVRDDSLVLERVDGPTMLAELRRRPWRMSGHARTARPAAPPSPRDPVRRWTPAPCRLPSGQRPAVEPRPRGHRLGERARRQSRLRRGDDLGDLRHERRRDGSPVHEVLPPPRRSRTRLGRSFQLRESSASPTRT